MKNSGKYLIVMAIAIWLMSACNTVKYVPENEYLLKSSRIQTDITDIPKDELNTYLRQQPNLKVFGVLPLALNVYNCAYKDTLSGWIWWKKTFNKAAQRLGNEPIIYSESLTRLSAQQLQKLLSNRGYINAQVRTNVNLNNRRADVKYIITGNKPYLLENYEITPQNDVLREVAADTSRTLIHKNMLFDSDVLNEERTRIARELTERGFYNFDKEYLMFVADSAGNKVNLRLDLRRYLRQNPDSTNRTVFRRYTIGNIYFHIHRNSSLTDDADEDTQHADTASANGFYLIQSGKKFISLNALMHNTYINPNSAYNSTNVERTYTALNALGAVKYVNISFVHREDSILDCNIVISPAKTFSTSVELEGTFLESEKYLGGAFRIGAINKNAFKGAEALSFQFRAALELQKNPFGQSTEKGLWAQEYGLQIGLNVPRFMLPLASYNFRRQVQANTEFTLNGSRQMRPAEFNAINISAGMKYVWNKQSFRHAFELFNMSFMGFEIAPEFYFKYLETGEYNIYNYEDRFILRMGYSGSYSAFNTNRPLKNYSTFRYSIETAGNLFYVANWILGLSKSKDDNYQILKIPFSQYIRSDFNVSYNQIFDKNNRFVYHFGMGLGIPYGNSYIIPYERRFFAGGANSVRGWSESTLGPGVYKRMPNVRSRDFNQVGDIKLDLNMEYRAKMFWLLEGALFLDAGNIWTFKQYDEQQGGAFKFGGDDAFYKQIAVAYGFGLRLDATMFVVRVDLGMKLFNPVLPRTQQWQTGQNFNLRDDFALHIAIGYPF